MDDFLATLASNGIATFAFRLALDALATFIVVELVYARVHRRRDYVFTYALVNVITFSLSFMLGRVPVELGFALGLFAVFGILRYRTEAIRMRDLTYLFVVIGLGIVNAVGLEHIAILELAMVDALIAGSVVVLERPGRRERVEDRPMTYDKLELLRPGNEAALRADLETRTGLRVQHVTVDSIDLVREVASITVHYTRSTEAGPPASS